VRLPRTRVVEVTVAASPDAVWEVLVDVARVGEWSHEARGAQWTKGNSAAVGNTFRGTNRLGRIRWSRRCTVTAAERPSRFSYRTHGGIFGDQTEWTFDLVPTGTGTLLRETYQILTMPRALEAAVVVLMPSHRDRGAALKGDLERIGALAAGRSQ